ncbi:hypothetical protein PENTCL1PPCAC_14539, partial [Pristionchus entomophagus]
RYMTKHVIYRLLRSLNLARSLLSEISDPSLNWQVCASLTGRSRRLSTCLYFSSGGSGDYGCLRVSFKSCLTLSLHVRTG